MKRTVKTKGRCVICGRLTNVKVKASTTEGEWVYLCSLACEFQYDRTALRTVLKVIK